MADQIKRLNFFKHQFLRASDFIDEQKYHMEMRRRHNRTLHTWGIAGSGLKVTFAQGATAVSVSPGMAIDSQGREIILTADKTVELSGLQAGSAVYITIAYAEKQTDPSNETGAEGNTRWTEDPTPVPSLTKPSDVGTNIVLARVTRNGTTVTGVDESERRSAGVEAGDLTVRVLTLSRPNVDAGTWPRLSCSGPNQSALENGSLKIDANREVFFTDGGQLRSFDNSHRIAFNRPNNRLELYEFGDIIFLTGGAAPAERMRVGGNGNVGIGVGGTADAPLHIAGGQWNVSASEGDFKIGNAAMRLKIGVALAGGGAGDARIRAHGGTNRLMLGSGASDTLTLLGDNVGIGTVAPGAKLEINNGDLLIKAAADDAGDIVFQSANGVQKARIYSDPSPGAGLMLAVGDNTPRLTITAEGRVAVGASVEAKRVLHAEGTEVHSGGSGGGFSFASRDNNGPFVENGANGSRWVWYAAGATARLWSASDKITVNTKGDLTVSGAIYTTNSDLYFTETNHVHTGIGNAVGSAAIENSTAPYNALMILGRSVQTTGLRRVVKLWDFLEVNGDLTVTGTLRAPSKVGFVVDDFVNRYGESLEQGDVVVIGDNQSSLFYGLKSNLPVPEIEIAQAAYDTRVCGIVDELTVNHQSEGGATTPDEDDDEKASKKSKKKSAKKEAEQQAPTTGPEQTFTPEEMEKLDSTKVGPGQFGTMVTHGSYAFCKVDADIAPISVGDLLTTSPTKGHAQKVLDPSKALGAVIGKALGALKKGKGKIPIIVTLQ